MKVTFVQPCIGRRPGEPYIRSWMMEPLAFAVLSALTPPEVERVFYDDRVEAIPDDEPTDLVALSVETYTARRAYQIAAAYRRRGVRVVMGGFHPTLAPDDAQAHADAIVIGEAEGVWAELLADARRGELRPRYEAPAQPAPVGRLPDRGLYAGKPYLPVSLVETGRGCRFHCDFCSISRFYRRSWTPRPLDDIVADLKAAPHRHVFFTDDNLAADPRRLSDLLEAITPLGIRWAGQMSMDATADSALLQRVRASGCAFVLIGFESLDASRLACMDKPVNAGGVRHGEVARRLRRHGIGVYATFVFGYDGDTPAAFEATYRFALRHRFFFTAFNHLVPFPGTPLYERLAAQRRLRNERWWLAPGGRFGEVVYRPDGMAAADLERLCFTYRRKFYGPLSIARRALNLRANCGSPSRAAFYLGVNAFSGREVGRRQSLPFGRPEEDAP